MLPHSADFKVLVLPAGGGGVEAMVCTRQKIDALPDMALARQLPDFDASFSAVAVAQLTTRF
jgi:hypothetical protein